MKANIKLILIIALLINSSFSTFAQTIEVKVGNTIYEYDTIYHIIQNKENVIAKKIQSHNCEYMKADSSNHLNIVKTIFSKERIKQFGNKTMSIIVYCNNRGEIKEVDFNVKGIESIIQFSELKVLEDSLKERGYLKVRSDCEKYPDYYYRINAIVRFGQLYRDE